MPTALNTSPTDDHNMAAEPAHFEHSFNKKEEVDDETSPASEALPVRST